MASDERRAEAREIAEQEKIAFDFVSKALHEAHFSGGPNTYSIPFSWIKSVVIEFAESERWRCETTAYSGVIDKSLDELYESMKGAYPGHIAETIERACELGKQQVRIVASGASLQYDPDTILRSAGANRLWRVELTGHEHQIEDRNSSPSYLTVHVSEIMQ